MTRVAKQPDLEARRLLRGLRILPPPRHTGADSVAAIRRDWQLAVKAFATREEVADVREREFPGPGGHPVRIRVYIPVKDPVDLPVVAYFHGGGFVFGDLYTAGATARALARRSGAIVVTVRYRLAPEHRLEQGRADCLAAVAWLAEHAHRFGGDTTRLAVAGDSAGGGIAAIVAQACRDQGPELKAQVLIYPVTDMNSHQSSRVRTIGLLTPERLDWIRAQIEKVNDLSDPTHSPLHATHLRGLAPAVVLTCGFDPLREEGLQYARGMADAGVTVHHLHYPAMIHGFVAMDRVLSAGAHALDRLSDCIRTAFQGHLTHTFEDDLPGQQLTRPARLDPMQRARELQVGALVARERLGQLTRALQRTRT